MNAVTQLALNAITSLRKYWSKTEPPEIALAELLQIRDAATQAIAEVRERVQDHQDAERMSSEGAHIHPDLVEQLH